MALGRSLQRSVSAITLLAWTPSGQEAKIGRWRQLSSTRPYVLSRFATETSIRGHPRQLKHLQRMRYVALNSASLSLLMWLCYRLPTTLLLLISPSFTVIEDPPMAYKRLLGSVVKAASLSRCVQVIMFSQLVRLLCNVVSTLLEAALARFWIGSNRISRSLVSRIWVLWTGFLL